MSNFPETITRDDEARIKAATLTKQIGAGNLMACGWRNASYTVGGPDDAFDVRVTGTVLRGRSHFIEITLELNDTYTVRRLRIPTARAKDKSIRVEEEATGVYCDQLGEVVYHQVNK